MTQSNCGTPLKAQDLGQNELLSSILESTALEVSKVKRVLNNLVVKWPANTEEHDAAEAFLVDSEDELFVVSKAK